MESRFLTSLIGSWPRSRQVLVANKKYRNGQLEEAAYRDLIKKETEHLVRMQEAAGIDWITCGELTRDNYVSFVSDKLDGVTCLSMAEMLDYVEDKAAFEEILTILDVPALSIKNAICNGKVRYQKGIAVDEAKLLKELTDQPIKITLPGPYLMTRSMWLPNLSGQHYANKEALAQDVLAVLKQEVDHLCEIGVDLVQFDEPVLTEVVFSQGKTRTFMCAALSEKKDPREELAFATAILKDLFAYIKDKPIKAGLHICRGNWSRDESILLTGSYTPLIDLLHQVDADVYFLEFSTPRAGEIASLYQDPAMKEKILGLGVMNPRLDETESLDQILNQVHKALAFTSPDKVWLNPDCGFATFANRAVNSEEFIANKLETLHQASQTLREEYDAC
ncbi:cobalamin-independent methionine synthase II family protein [Facklamia languida]